MKILAALLVLVVALGAGASARRTGARTRTKIANGCNGARSAPRSFFCSERKLAVHVIGAMERRETTANEHWTVKAVFAFVLTCLVGAEWTAPHFDRTGSVAR
jgi:hypothetical protein